MADILMFIIEIIDRAIQFVINHFFVTLINYLYELIGKLYFIFFRKGKKSKKKLNIISKSENYIIVDKPADVVINSNDISKISIQTLLRKQYPEIVNHNLIHEFYFVHRLDFATSGILCLPLNKNACVAVSNSLKLRLTQKYYVALLNGNITSKKLQINIGVGDDSRFININKKMCLANEKHCFKPRDCLTFLVVASRGYYNQRTITKVFLKPITGRRHQLRVHCDYIGNPILGDYTYGTNYDKTCERMFLHAIKFIVPNPIENIEVETSDPFDESKLKNLKLTENVVNNAQNAYMLLDEMSNSFEKSNKII